MIFGYAVLDDYPLLKEIRYSTHKMHYENEPKYFKEEDNFFTINYYKDKLDKNQIYKLEVENEIIGYVMIKDIEYKNDAMIRDQRILMIEEIAIVNKYQNKGFGKEAMKKIEVYAQKNGYTSIELNVWGFNKIAMDFYQRLGMKISRIRMEKRL